MSKRKCSHLLIGSAGEVCLNCGHTISQGPVTAAQRKAIQGLINIVSGDTSWVQCDELPTYAESRKHVAVLRRMLAVDWTKERP